MKSTWLALGCAATISLGLFAVPAGAATTPTPMAPAASRDESGVKLAHYWHNYCAWGPWAGWWHLHTRWGMRACSQRYRYWPAPQPRCWYGRWGRVVCSY